MNHQFNIDTATKYGIEVAIFLENIAFWTQRNIANKKNFKENRYWVYNSLESWTILFPYWSLQNIRTVIDKCIKNDLLLKNNSFNKRKGDRTSWFSMTDKAIELYPAIKSLIEKECPKEEKVIHTHLLESTNGMLESTNAFVRINTALPDNKPDNKQQIKSSCFSDQKYSNEKKHSWAEKPKAPLASVENQSTSFRRYEIPITKATETNPVRNPLRPPKPEISPTHFTDAIKALGDKLAMKEG